MIKKLILAAVCIAALGAVYAIDPGGHVSTLTGYVTKLFKPSLDYQINRAEKLIGKLDASIEENQEFLAREKVQLAKLEESLAKDRVAVKTRRDRVVALRKQFGQGEQLVSVNLGKRNELGRELSQLKIADRKLETTEKIFDTRKQRFTALRDKVNEMLSSKETMKLRLEEMKAELEAVRLNEAHAGQYSVDDSEFKAVVDLLEEIDTEVKTRKELAEMRAASHAEVPVDTTVDDTVLDDVDAYLGASK
jgi:chromosome segregation ATPase